MECSGGLQAGMCPPKGVLYSEHLACYNVQAASYGRQLVGLKSISVTRSSQSRNPQSLIPPV